MIAIRGNIILADRIFRDGIVICRGQRIEEIQRVPRPPAEATVRDTRGGWIAPGFIDIHVHGGAGADYMDGTAAAVRTVNQAHLRHGTTTVFPTTTTGSPVQVRRMLDACLEVRSNWSPADGANIAGVHLYGPYFAEDKVGCHAAEGRRDPSPEEYDEYFRLGIVKIATCAAELPGAVEFFRAARKRRCFVTCGHSNATWTDMERAFKSGMRHVDHFWCAMSSVPSLRAQHGTPMQGSMAEFVLSISEMSTEVIADGEHLSRELLEFAYKMKGADRLCLVTDSNRAMDMPPGEYRFGPIEDGSWFTSNGKVGLVPGAGLASSVVPLSAMVKRMKQMTSAPLEDVVRMASHTPAVRTGIDRDVGSIEPGKRADLVILDKRLDVRRVFIAGTEVSLP